MYLQIFKLSHAVNIYLTDKMPGYKCMVQLKRVSPVWIPKKSHVTFFVLLLCKKRIETAIMMRQIVVARWRLGDFGSRALCWFLFLQLPVLSAGRSHSVSRSSYVILTSICILFPSVVYFLRFCNHIFVSSTFSYNAVCCRLLCPFSPDPLDIVIGTDTKCSLIDHKSL